MAEMIHNNGLLEKIFSKSHQAIAVHQFRQKRGTLQTAQGFYLAFTRSATYHD
jgi:hypothetical protein